MRKLILGLVALSVLVLGLFAQAPNKRGEATLTLDGGKVSIDYGRPELKGRDVASMINPGDEWRMGADQPTKLTSDTNLKFGNKVVPKGTYILRAKLVAKEQWHLLIQKEDKTVVAEVPLSYQKTETPVELMTIKLEKQGNGGRYILEWGNFGLSTDFQKAP